MASKMKKSIVNFYQYNIKEGEVYGAYGWYRNSNLSPDVNSIYFMSKPRFEYYAFFWFMPSVRNYYKILKAIEKLKIGSLPIKDTKTMQAKGETVLTKQDKGFKDIVAFLKRNQYIRNEASVTELRYWESYYVTKPPPFGLHLKCLNATVNGEDKFLFENALHELKEKADIYVRGKITTFVVILASFISLLSVFLVVYTYLPSLRHGQI